MVLTSEEISPPSNPSSYSPLLYDDTLSTAGITNIVLIEQGFPDFQSYVNAQSFAIMYSPDSTMTDLSAVLHQKFTTITRIAVVSHYHPTPTFINNAPLFSSSDLLPGTTTYSENVQGLINILQGFNVANIDFLACNSLLDPNWVQYYSILQAAHAGVILGASSDNTGNLKYGGNWTMENTNENVQTIYFNSSIEKYASLLATIAITYPFGILNYSYTVGISTASLLSVTGTITGAVIIPPFITVDSVNYTVAGHMAATFTSQTLITSVVITPLFTSLSNSAFKNCTKLKTITFPNTLVNAGTSCLQDCILLTDFNWPTAMRTVPIYFMHSCNAYSRPLIIPNWITTISHSSFPFTNIPSIFIPPNCVMGSYMVTSCNQMTSATIYSTGWLPADAFQGCTALKTATFGPGVTGLSENAFNVCAQLSSVTLPSTLLQFNNTSFRQCSKLKYMQIPSSVTLFGATNAHTAAMYITVFDFMHETSFPAELTGSIQLANSAFVSGVSKFNVSTKVQNMPNYLAMVARYSNVTYTGFGTVDFTQYISAIPMTSSTSVTLDAISSADLTDVTIIGSSVAEQKSFTSNSVLALFGANTAEKQLVLPVGSILPGFSSSLTKQVYLFNASAKVAYGKVTRIFKASILNLNFYAVLDAGDTLIVETNGDYVTITRSENIFTFVTGKNVTSTMPLGDTYVYDGLSMLLGSLYGILRPTAVDLMLTALNSQLTLTSSAALPSYGPTLTSDATITLSGGITEFEAQNTFFFRTDEQICLDASFVSYYVDTTKWTTNMSVISPKNGTVTSNYYVSGDAVGKDFLRDLARQLFGTYLAVDLFTNEDNVVADINTKCDTVSSLITLLLRTIDKTQGSIPGLSQDSSGNYFFKDNSTTSNISREIFNEMITQAPQRFNDMTLYQYNAGVNDGFYRLPILAGDTLSYKITIGSAAGQAAAVPTGRTTLAPRTYTVTLNVI
jgi:hypothetical protein